jgi:CDP-diglyceride synthetase
VGDWWLIGTETTNWGWLTEDVANQYCIIAKHGGLLALVLFIRLLVLGFREVGICRSQAQYDRPTEMLMWAFGVLLFSHLATFFGTSYFDQTNVLWLLTLALVASLRLVTERQQELAQTAPLESRLWTGEVPRGVEAPAQ